MAQKGMFFLFLIVACNVFFNIQKGCNSCYLFLLLESLVNETSQVSSAINMMSGLRMKTLSLLAFKLSANDKSPRSVCEKSQIRL